MATATQSAHSKELDQRSSTSRHFEDALRQKKGRGRRSACRTLSGVLCRAALSRTSRRELAVSGTDRFRQDALAMIHI